MDLKFRGKNTFITGSTAGIGLATAVSMAMEGADIILNSRNAEKLNSTIQDLQKQFPGIHVSGLAGDFSKPAEVAAIVKTLPDVDILINNVGIYTSEAFLETPDEDWYSQFEVNVMSGVRLSKKVLPAMLRKNWGRILFVSSECATLVPVDMIPYSMTKAAVLAVSRGLAQLTKGTGVTVNTIVPGSTLTAGVDELLKNSAQQAGKTKAELEHTFFTEVRTSSLLQRFATVEEIANTITYIASPLSAATNGAAIKVDGGSMGGII